MGLNPKSRFSQDLQSVIPEVFKKFSIFSKISLDIGICSRIGCLDENMDFFMPIPEFADHGGLPPFVNGDPTSFNARSPYLATMLELVERFCTSERRAKLLKGLNEYRRHLYSGGFVKGSQWIDGSFVEDVEKTQKRSPNDIDVVTLYHRPFKYQTDPGAWSGDYVSHLRAQFFDTNMMKPVYLCDTYDIDLDAGSRPIVRNTTYWFGLFSDMRGSGSKKGILEVALAVDPMEFLAVDHAIGSRFSV